MALNRYTFFEVATQKGYLLEVFAMLLPKHWEREAWAHINSDEIGIVAKPHGEENVVLDFRSTGRQAGESNMTWRDRVRGEAEAKWLEVSASRAAFAKKLREETLAAEALAAEALKKEEVAVDPLPKKKTAKVQKPAEAEPVPSPRSAAK